MGACEHGIPVAIKIKIKDVFNYENIIKFVYLMKG